VVGEIQWVYPFASAIDTPLPIIPQTKTSSRKGDPEEEEPRPEMFVIMRSSAKPGVPLPEGSVVYDRYPPGKGIEVSVQG
jgi:hypothetical protein